MECARDTAKREENYDLLRVICTVAVILIHVSNLFLKASFSGFTAQVGFVFEGSLLATVILDTLPRFAIQCFVMLSGAFNLDNKRNADYKYFYSKALKNIGVTAIVFSAAYMIYEVLKEILKIEITGNTGGGNTALCGLSARRTGTANVVPIYASGSVHSYPGLAVA